MADKQAEGGAAPERKKPQKLGSKKPQQQPTPDQSEGDGGAEAEAGGKADAEADADASANADGEEEAEPEPEQQKSRQASQSRRRQSRGRGRKGQESDSESVARSDASANGGRRQRQRQKKQGGGGGGPLDDITENVPGGDAVNGAGDMVQNTAGQAVGQAGNALGGITGGQGQKQGGGEEDEDGGKGEQLRLRLELNLDIEIQLKAKIHGDLTLGLLYVYHRLFSTHETNITTATKIIAATSTPTLRTTNVDDTYNRESWSFGTCWITICSLSFLSLSCKVRLDRRRRDDFHPLQATLPRTCVWSSPALRPHDWHDLDNLLMLITRSHTPTIKARPRMISTHDLPKVSSYSCHDQSKVRYMTRP
jgi:hypothetical protein